MKYRTTLRLIFFLIVLTEGVHAQNKKTLDSLNLRLVNSSPAEKEKILLNLCLYYYDANQMAEAIPYTDKGFSLAKTLADSMEMVRFYRIKGLLLAKLERSNECITVLKSILPISQRNKYLKETEKVLNGLGNAYAYEAEYSQALKYFYQSLILRQENGDEAAISIALNNVGYVYYKIEDFATALRYYKKSLDLKRKVKSKYDLTLLLLNMALCYSNLNDSSRALKTVSEAMDACNPECDTSIQVTRLNALGIICRLRKNLKYSKDYFTQSYILSQKSNNKRFQVENLNALAEIAIKENKIKAGKEYLIKGDKILRNSSFKGIKMDNLGDWAELYSKSGNFELASQFQKKYIDLNNKLVRSKAKALLTVQSEFNEYENKKTIQSQNLELRLKEETIYNHRLVIALVGVISIALIASIIILFKRYQRKRADNILLDLKVKERTRAIEDSFLLLTRKIEVQNQLHTRTATQLGDQMRRLRGLVSIILSEKADSKTIKEAGALISDTEEQISTLIMRDSHDN